MAAYWGTRDAAFIGSRIIRPSFVVEVKDADTNPDLYQQQNPGRGTRSLEETSIRAASYQMRYCSSKTFTHIAWHVAIKLLKRVWPISFETWKAFVEVYGHEETFPDASITLPRYFALPPNFGKGMAWLTILNLQTSYADFRDLVELSSITSLAVLILNGSYASTASQLDVGDRLIRAWSRSVEEAGAFANLRIISFHRCTCLTLQSLELLTSINTLLWTFFHHCTDIELEHSGMVGREKACNCAKACGAPKKNNSELKNSQESSESKHRGWNLFNLQQPEDSDSQDRSILRLGKLPSLEYCHWLDWYIEEVRRLSKVPVVISQQSWSESMTIQNKPMLSFHSGSHPSGVDEPLIFRRLHDSHAAVGDTGSIVPQKRQNNEQMVRQTSQRQVKDSKIRDTDFAQFF